MDRMDALVRAAGGRLYAAKDARMPKDMFESGYPELDNFRRFRESGYELPPSRAACWGVEPMNTELQRLVIVGATSAIARAMPGRRWIVTPSDMLLVGRDPEKLERVAVDLRIRSPLSKITTAVVSFLDTSEIREVIARFADGGPIDIAMVAHGTLPGQRQPAAGSGRLQKRRWK